MVQGKTKGLQNKASSSRHAARAAAAPKKGKKHIPPKKVALIKQASMHQVRCHVFLVKFLPNHLMARRNYRPRSISPSNAKWWVQPPMAN
jgi:hypothetical protein